MKEALKYLQAGAIVPVDMETTILLVNALKEALAQPAQELWAGVAMDSREHLYKRYDDLYVVYLNGVYDGKKSAKAEAERGRERNFCERCGKRTADLTVIHTCTPPQEKNNG